jgi:hemerythrin-like domain-containing protein
MRNNRADVDRGARGLVARLHECHDRIRQMLTIATEIVDCASDDQARDDADRVGRYFSRGYVRHTRDEEESLIPRLRDARVGSAVEQMHREHGELEALVRSLVDSCRALSTAAPPSERLRVAVATAADALTPALVRHLDSEETLVFPEVERLDATTQAEVLKEMDARRERDR